ncbi:hypothetical protein SAMN00808754_2385 [Thermanaeromonas toyohensis ToBE]|uniref:DUF5320 domain-containing protein n=1 Tax=Thermanaeromonas toyohensis ToBE TaxID=698762 RepID=A0A1W1VYR9_9FIRM|nr:DUF5320 domain-containing protein [Thermanaeromonas toyohensis]SMB98522.1 hypothetical protein SAMN00808754_2385 [Thermanaeromonas toyohensis ToBE]
MCCHPKESRHPSNYCCCRPFHFHRRYYTKEEEIALLEKYLEDLKAEQRAVEEQIKKMKEQ